MKINVRLTDAGKEIYGEHADALLELKKGDWIDLRAAEDVVMEPGEHRIISLGIAMELPEGYEAWLLPRSSTYKNYGIMMWNSAGIIDNSYSGNDDIWGFPAYSPNGTIKEIHKGDRICQFRVVENQPKIFFNLVEDLGNPNRGGYGSTGIK